MPVIDVMPGLTGPLPWVPGLPVVARVAVLAVSLGGAVVAGTVLGRRARREP